MKILFRLVGLISILISASLFSIPAKSEQLLLQQSVPSCWKFKDLKISDSHIGIFYFDDNFKSARLQGFPPGRIQIFDRKSRVLVSDLLTMPGERFDFLRDNKIALILGDEGGDYRIRVLTFEGNELLRLDLPDDGIGRQVVLDLKGREFALVDLHWGSRSVPAIIYDIDSGRVKFRYGPLTLPKELEERGLGLKFLYPVGEDNLFLMGIGAGIYLKHYDGRKDIWAIKDVGGNIQGGRFLDDNFFALTYWRPETKNKGAEGLIIIDWKTGRIVFRLENIKEGKSWQKRMVIPFPEFIHISEEDKSLILGPSSSADNLMIKIPFDPTGKTWIEEKMKRYRAQVSYKIVGKSKEYQKVFYGEYVVDEDEEGDVKTLRIKKVNLLDED